MDVFFLFQNQFFTLDSSLAALLHRCWTVSLSTILVQIETTQQYFGGFPGNLVWTFLVPFG